MFSFIWNNFFYYPSLNLIMVLYDFLFSNLGLAIIAIAVAFKLILLPFMKRQNEMTRKMSSLKPQLEELQKKYKNNKEKLSQEQVKLYKKSGYNPLGCLVTFVPQLLILSVLNQVIRRVTSGNLEGIYPFVKDWFFGGSDISVNTNFIIWDLTKSYSQISGEFGKFATISLLYLLLCLLVGLSQYLMSKFRLVMQDPLMSMNNGSNNKDKKKSKEDMSPEEMQQKMMGSFTFLLPLSTVFIAISAPAALSVYWIVQSFMLLLQYFILDWDKTRKGVQNAVTIIKEKRKKEKE